MNSIKKTKARLVSKKEKTFLDNRSVDPLFVGISSKIKNRHFRPCACDVYHKPYHYKEVCDLNAPQARRDALIQEQENKIKHLRSKIASAKKENKKIRKAMIQLDHCFVEIERIKKGKSKIKQKTKIEAKEPQNENIKFSFETKKLYKLTAYSLNASE